MQDSSVKFNILSEYQNSLICDLPFRLQMFFLNVPDKAAKRAFLLKAKESAIKQINEQIDYELQELEREQ